MPTSQHILHTYHLHRHESSLLSTAICSSCSAHETCTIATALSVVLPARTNFEGLKSSQLQASPGRGNSQFTTTPSRATHQASHQRGRGCITQQSHGAKKPCQFSSRGSQGDQEPSGQESCCGPYSSSSYKDPGAAGGPAQGMGGRQWHHKSPRWPAMPSWVHAWRLAPA
jgi:hypothetical protein